MEGNRQARLRRGSTAMNFYPPLLFFAALFILVGTCANDLIGYPVAAAFVFVLMALLRHHSALSVLGLAAGEQSELARYFVARTSIAPSRLSLHSCWPASSERLASIVSPSTSSLSPPSVHRCLPHTTNSTRVRPTILLL